MVRMSTGPSAVKAAFATSRTVNPGLTRDPAFFLAKVMKRGPRIKSGVTMNETNAGATD